jgi:hypothetical protein
MYTLQVAAGFAFITSLYGDFMQVSWVIFLMIIFWKFIYSIFAICGT